jgi:hypothetical protein
MNNSEWLVISSANGRVMLTDALAGSPLHLEAMMRKLLVITALLAVFGAAACGGGGGTPSATSGTISGTLTVGGPVNNSVPASVGLFAPGASTPLQACEAGRVTSAAGGSITGRAISFSFTDVPFGSYEIGVYFAGTSGNTFYYRSEPQAVSASAPSITGFSDTLSFAGAKPWGTISGVIDLGGDWPAGQIVFVGFTPPGGAFPLQYVFTEHQESDGFVQHTGQGQVVFNIACLSYNTWTVGLYGYNPQTHAVTTYGLRNDPVVVGADDPNITNVNFPADFAGDPGADPALATISGVLHLSGPLPQTAGFMAIAVNTIPPQAGAPISTFDIEPGDEDSNYDIPFILRDVPAGEYSLGAFVYDFASHTAVYFASYNGTLAVDTEHMAITGLELDGDVSLID